MDHTQQWIPLNEGGRIQKIFYVYSLDITPPVYVVYVALKEGKNLKLSECDISEFPSKVDKMGLTVARSWPQEIPLQVQAPKPERERGPSCSIC